MDRVLMRAAAVALRLALRGASVHPHRAWHSTGARFKAGEALAPHELAQVGFGTPPAAQRRCSGHEEGAAREKRAGSSRCVAAIHLTRSPVQVEGAFGMRVAEPARAER